MKKIFVGLIVVIAAAVIAFLVLNEPKPGGNSGSEAEALTDKMWAAINKSAWDSLSYISWSFRSAHHYRWDRSQEMAEIKWDDKIVLLDLSSMNFIAFANGEKLTGSDAEELKDKAWEYWCNDSFWLNAPAKARDAGTTRSIVKTERGDALLVEYASGGVTPGDAYLWILDDTGLPVAFKMWVGIIPIGGVEASWDGWKSVGDTKIATEHDMAGLSIPITDLKGGQLPSDIGIDESHFSGLNDL